MTQSRRVDALAAAADTLDALEIDQRYPIDPFAAIDQLGLTLHIAKLDNLLGTVIPEGNGGVLITSERNPGIQRYTAAHEIGHWILHKNHLRMDSEFEVLGRPSDDLERDAQLFAAYFLMPTPLLDSAVSAYDLRSGQVTPQDVYLISRDLNVSYEAAARRLRTARLLDQRDLDAVLTFGRLPAMQRAFDGHRPDDGQAAVWHATTSDDDVRLVAEEHDEVLVTLPEHRLSGWRWLNADELTRRGQARATPRLRPVPPSPAADSDDQATLPLKDPRWQRRPADIHAALDLLPADPVMPSLSAQPLTDEPASVVSDTFVAVGVPPAARARRRQRTARASGSGSPQQGVATTDDQLTIGGQGTRRLVVRCGTPGTWTLRLYYAHAFNPQVEPILSYQVHVDVQPTPTHAFQQRRLTSDLDVRLAGDPEDLDEFVVVGDAGDVS